MRCIGSVLTGIVIFFTMLATNISAEEGLNNEVSETCDELEQECWARCEEIRSEAARKNCEERGYSGCALDVAGCISSPPGSCNLAYGSDYWCEMPGYLACVEPYVAEYLLCLENCNDKFRSGELDISLAECSGGFNKSLGCTGDIYSGVQGCKNRSCDEYCKEQGMAGGEWVYYNATLGGYDRCQCYESIKLVPNFTAEDSTEEWVVWYADNIGFKPIYITTKNKYEEDTPSCSYPGGGIDCSVKLKKILLLGPFSSWEEANVAICSKLTNFRRGSCGPTSIYCGMPWADYEGVQHNIENLDCGFD